MQSTVLGASDQSAPIAISVAAVASTSVSQRGIDGALSVREYSVSAVIG